ncbi:hypothetical protein HDU98_006847 [Podochytrium sp. JEL0797]|nr:hypothetical protein HDU98_006847 [Podochytrium sp. JEL0797]
MKYITTLPKPHHLGVDVAHSIGTSYPSQTPPNAAFPDVISVKVDPSGHYITAMYNDRSLFIWDVTDVKHVGKYQSFLNHSDCVWGVEVVPDASPDSHRSHTPIPSVTDPISTPPPPPGLPPGTFTTYSSDTTIRFWNVDPHHHLGDEAAGRYFRRNVYSKELIQIVYTDTDAFLEACKRRSGGGEQDETTSAKTHTDKSGIRSLRISADAKLMASGDRAGNLRVYELDTFTQKCVIEAHDAEILGIDFTTLESKASPGLLMATASRDRLVHIFDVRRNGATCSLIQTLDDHTSSITGVKFAEGGSRLLTSGADKSIVFRTIQNNPNKSPTYTPHHKHTTRSTLFDMTLSPTSPLLASITQNRLDLFHTTTGKLTRSHTFSETTTPTTSSFALLKVAIDPTGKFAVTAASDRVLRVVHLGTGDVLAVGEGHAEGVTGLLFLEKGRIVSTGADGCVFVWRWEAAAPRPGVRGAREDEVDECSTVVGIGKGRNGGSAGVMKKEVGGVECGVRSGSVGGEFMKVFEEGGEEELPVWARTSKNMSSAEAGGFASMEGDPRNLPVPKRGMWASRVEKEGVVHLFSESSDIQKPVATFANLFDRRYSIESTSVIATPTGSEGSTSLNTGDLVIQDLEPLTPTDEEESAPVHSNPTETLEEIPTPQEDPTLFMEDTQTLDHLNPSTPPNFAVSQPLPRDPDAAEDPPVSQDSSLSDPKAFSFDSSSNSLSSTSSIPDGFSSPSGSVEADLAPTLDPTAVVRQSMSAQHHVLARDTSKSGSGGGIVIETVLDQIRQQQLHFETLLNGSTAEEASDPAAAHVVEEMAEKKPKEDASSPLRSPLVSPGDMGRSAVNKDVIDSIAMARIVESGDGEDVYTEEFEEEVDQDDDPEEIDTAQVLQDLKLLQTLTSTSAALLHRIHGSTRPDEQHLSRELQTALRQVQASAAEALAAVSVGQEDKATVGLLERYSDLLVGMVRDKLNKKEEAEQ